jgi:hypothetical protein
MPRTFDMPSTMFRMAATIALGIAGFAAQAGLSNPPGGSDATPIAGMSCFGNCDRVDPYGVASNPVFPSVPIDAPITLMLLGGGLLLLRCLLRRSGLAI